MYFFRVNMAPEYATRKDITDKIDVYSYGIVVLEIVSGKSNSKRENNDYLLNEVTEHANLIDMHGIYGVRNC